MNFYVNTNISNVFYIYMNTDILKYFMNTDMSNAFATKILCYLQRCQIVKKLQLTAALCNEIWPTES